MATLLASRGLPIRQLQLPPSLRTSIYQHATCRRSFSSTPARKAVDLETLLAAPDALLDTVHSAGIPWFAAIPLTAVIVRGVIVYYLAAKPDHKRAIIASQLQPLSQGVSRHEFATWRANDTQTSQPMPLFVRRMRDTRKGIFLTLANRHKIGKKLGAPLFSWRPFANLGLLMTFTEALRVKCGAKEGPLPLLVDTLVDAYNVTWATVTGLLEFIWTQLKNDVAGTAQSPEDLKSQADLLAERIWAAREASSAKIDAVPASQETQAALSGLDGAFDAQFSDPLLQLSDVSHRAYTHLLDPSMKLEGLSWCPDLSVADPTMMLPASFALAMLAMPLIRLASTAQKPVESEKRLSKLTDANKDAAELLTHATKEASGLSKKIRKLLTLRQLRRIGMLRIGLVGLAGFIAYMSMNWPAAVLLYLVPSLVITGLQARFLRSWYPLPPAIKACKRPLRFKVRRHLRGTELTWHDRRMHY